MLFLRRFLDACGAVKSFMGSCVPCSMLQILGSQVRVKVVKNKLAAPYRTADFEIEFGRGISREGELIDFGTQQGLVSKSGAWFSMGEQSLGQGKEKARQFLRNNPEVAEGLEMEIRKRLREQHGNLKLPARPVEDHFEEHESANENEV